MAKWQGHGKKTSFSSEVSLKSRFTYIISDTEISGECGGGAAYDGGDCRSPTIKLMAISLSDGGGWWAIKKVTCLARNAPQYLTLLPFHSIANI